MTSTYMMRGALLLLALTAATASVSRAQDAGAVDAALRARIDSVVEAARARDSVRGISVAVARGGTLLLARGYGLADAELSIPATAETVYRIGSITKQFTAVAVMQLAAQGKLALDDEITRHLPDFPVQGHRVTIWHLLTHTSGIKSYTGLGPQHMTTTWRFDLPPERVVALFKDVPFDFNPGEKWQYNNSAFFLLGVIIEKVSGEKYPDYLRRHILDPLGLVNTSYCNEAAIVSNRARGYRRVNGAVKNALPISMTIPGAAGAMCSTVLDLVRWEDAMSHRRILAESLHVAMETEARLNDGSGTKYGFGLSLAGVEGRRVVRHGGGINGFTSELMYLPDEDLTVTVLTNAEGGNPKRVAEAIVALLAPPRTPASGGGQR